VLFLEVADFFQPMWDYDRAPWRGEGRRTALDLHQCSAPRRRYSARKDGERGRCQEYFHDNVSYASIACSFSIKALPKQTI
jgi:hypothetical protein